MGRHLLSASHSACPKVFVTFSFPEHETELYSPTTNSLPTLWAAATCGFHSERYAYKRFRYYKQRNTKNRRTVMFWWLIRLVSVAMEFLAGSQVEY